MDMVSSVERVLGDARALVGEATAGDLNRQTACSDWNARSLIEHSIGVVSNFNTAFGGGQLTPPAAPGSGEASGADLNAAYGQAVDALLATVKAPGALEKSIKLPFGEMPGQRALGIVMADQMIHCWDLSKALGKSYTMDETLAAMTLRGMHELIGANPNARGEGRAFAAEVPCSESAPVQDRLLAFSGRQP